MSQTLTTTTTTTSHTPPQDQKNTAPPTLQTTPTTSPPDLIAALRLLSDSIAQQRQATARSLLSNPLALAPLLALLAAAYKLTYHERADFAIFITTAAGCVTVFLAMVRWLCVGYIEEAERVGTWRWLREGEGEMGVYEDGGRNTNTNSNSNSNSNGNSRHKSKHASQSQNHSPRNPNTEDEQIILITRFGERIIGTLILRGQPTLTSGGKIRGHIRGWTVERRYRGFGVGRELLEGAVGVCRARGWAGPEFDAAHANAKRVVPGWLDGGFERRERWARGVLEEVKRDVGGRS